MDTQTKSTRPPPELRFARLCGWNIDVLANRLQQDQVERRLTPKAMGVLRELIKRQGDVVRRDDLLGIVWPDGFPADDVLTHAITDVRRALGDDPRAPRIIETIPKVGYRLVAPVEVHASLATDSVANAIAEPSSTSDFPPRFPWPMYLVLVALAALCLVSPGVRQAGSERWASAPHATAAGATVGLPLRPMRFTADPSREQFPSVSPSGGAVTYAALDPNLGATRIMTKSVAVAALPSTLTHPEVPFNDDLPVWSPDGKQIAFLRRDSEECSIFVVPALGGQERRVSSCSVQKLDFMDWTADARALLVARRDYRKGGATAPATIHRIDLGSGEVNAFDYRPLPDGEEDSMPKSSPDGRWVAFRRGALPYSDLFVMRADGGQARRLTAVHSMIRGFAWEPDSAHIVMGSDHSGQRGLYRVTLDGGPLIGFGPEDAQFPAIARAAPVIVFQQEERLTQLAQIVLGPGERTSATGLIAASSRSDKNPALSPSGRRLAFVSVRSGAPQVWVYEIRSGKTFPVSELDGVSIGPPQWAPDESNLLFVARRAGDSALFRSDIASRRTVRLGLATEQIRFGSYARDGRSIFFSSTRSGKWQVWSMQADGSAAQPLNQQGGADPRDFLGDGAIYYVKEESPGLYRLDLSSRDERRVSAVINYRMLNTYTVRAERIYFVAQLDDGAWIARAPIHLQGMPPAIEPAQLGVDRSAGGRDEIERMYRLGVPRVRGGIAFSEDLKTAVVAQVTRDETDLMIAALSR